MATTFFVSGHMDLTKEEFAEHYEPRIRAAHAAGASFVVGDAHGCDFMAQRLLASLELGQPKDAGRVRVFHMLERPRHSFGSGYGSRDPNLPKDSWSGRRGGFPLVGGFSSDEERDAAMTAASDDDIAWVRPVKDKRHSGTAKNLARRAAQRKAARAAEMHTWPVFNVNTRELADDGERYVSVSPAGEGHGVDVRLPQELVDRLRDARRAVAEARRAESEVEAEIRLVVSEQEGG